MICQREISHNRTSGESRVALLRVGRYTSRGSQWWSLAPRGYERRLYLPMQLTARVRTAVLCSSVAAEGYGAQNASISKVLGPPPASFRTHKEDAPRYQIATAQRSSGGRVVVLGQLSTARAPPL